MNMRLVVASFVYHNLRASARGVMVWGIRTRDEGSSVVVRLKLVHFSRVSKFDHSATSHDFSVELSSKTVNSTWWD